jgi:lipid-A-disaccharide synthase
MKKIVIVAGDHSGDIYGGMLANDITILYPQIKIYSIGGKNLAKHSAQVIDLISHAVMGLTEVISSLGKLLKLFNQSVKEINKIRPDLIIVIDAPDFNLRLIKRLNKQYPVFYYVSPQVWAWREGRVKQIREYVNRMVVLFQFERDFYAKRNVGALYFGHPLLEIIKPKNPAVKNTISLMPGSRKSEIKRHMSLLIETKNILEKKLPNYSFQIIKPDNIPDDFYEQFNCNAPIVIRSNQILEESKFILCASGTATLELAILNIPHLIFYKVNSLTWILAKMLVKVKFAGIVNILCDKKIVEEFLQDQANAHDMAEYTLRILSDEYLYGSLKNNLRNACKLLEPLNANENFAQYIGNYLAL